MYIYIVWLFALIIIHTISGNVLPMDQVIAQAASQVQDTALLWDDSSILVELDMRFTPEQWKRIQESRGDYGRYRRKRKAYKHAFTRWDNGKVPYSISEGFTREGIKVIEESMKEWSRVTCVEFRQASGNEPSVTFVPTGGCSSNVGKSGRVGQPLTLGSGCLVKGVVIHEIGHALGFFHEQSRPDRDYYVSINKENILPNMGYNFEKYDDSTIDTYNIPYDLESIMHYGPYYFTSNGRKTITARDPSKTDLMGNRYGLTFNDIWLANSMYSCAKRYGCDMNKRCGSSAFLGKDCRCWCKGDKKEEPVQYCDTRRPITHISTGVKPTSKPVIKTEEPDGLVDIHIGSGCSDWAEGGFCDSDAYTMKYCKRTCYEYRMRKTTTPPDGDRHPHCSYWASRGECDNNPSYMRVYCKSSCGVMVTKCRDTVPGMCNLFQKECFSKNLQSIMRKFCPKTCHSCTRDQRIASCQDVAPNACGLYALKGKCVDSDMNIKKKMQILCPKACGLCERAADEGSSRGGRTSRLVDRNCVDRIGYCLNWSKKGHCKSLFSKTFMKIFCKRSCNLC